MASDSTCSPSRVPLDILTMSCHELTDRLKSEAIRLGFDAVGVAPAVATAGLSQLSPLARFRPCRRNGLSAPESGSPAHPSSVLEGVRSVIVVSLVYGRTANLAMQVSDRAQRQGRPVRCRVAIITPHLAEARRAARVAAQRVPRHHGTRRRRHGSAPGTRLCAAGRAGLDRQEHHADRPQAGQLHVSRRPAGRRRARVRRSARCRPLRKLHPLPGPLPDPGLHRPVRSSMPAAASATGPSSTAARYPQTECLRAGRLGFRLRRLPGCLPVEPQSAARAPCRARRAARVDRTRI